MCCLRPGISDNIQVRSIVGRFLEHTRVYLFHNDGDEQLYCASADLMERNMFYRVEVAFPVLDPAFRERITRELRLHLADNTQAWTLGADGNYTRAHAGESAVTAQQDLLESLAEP